MDQTEYRCEPCGVTATDPIAHESHYHDGAQTCWPTDSEHAT